MRNIHKIIAFGLPLAALATYGITTNTVSADDGDTAQDEYNNDMFPRALKYLGSSAGTCIQRPRP